ncbi:MAG: hypothetical protein U0324_19380 [Polyangiales bacterium]
MRTTACLAALAAFACLTPAESSAQTRRAVPRVVRAAAPRIAVPRVVAPRVVPWRMSPHAPTVAAATPRRGGILRAAASVRPAAPTSPVVAVLQRMETTLAYTRYSPDNRIDPLMGHYEIDAAGLVTWVLRRATPAAHRAIFAQVRARSPTARDYHDILASTPAPGSGEAWARIPTVGGLRPGDVIAWRRAPGAHGGAAHVAFVAAAPVRQAARGGWLVRVTDSTAVPHDNDTRGPQSRHHSGLGTGTLLLTADPTTDAPTGYGWAGARASVATVTAVALGRPLR